MTVPKNQKCNSRTSTFNRNGAICKCRLRLRLKLNFLSERIVSKPFFVGSDEFHKFLTTLRVVIGCYV